MTKHLGIFDSGLGGLTVLQQLIKNNKYEKITYFGDTGRVPYGTRSRETIIKYAKQDVRFLLSRGVTEIVIACGTVSANALEALLGAFDLPIVGVIDTSAKAAVGYTKNKKVGIIGTSATVQSGAYERMIRACDPEVQVMSVACPLFVPLVECGFSEPGNEITAKTCEYYLAPLKAFGADTVVLGCTHYPVIAGSIGHYLGGVQLVDNGIELAKRINTAPEPPCPNPQIDYFVSDEAGQFEKNAALMRSNLPGVRAVEIDIEKY